MFSFHKPKIYRSLAGCCICKAKSSSSRFTDSKKYEVRRPLTTAPSSVRSHFTTPPQDSFIACFRTSDKRSGEICNACVLLVKRWKKLPPGTQRDWRHVVDARAGPGTKSGKLPAKSPTTSLFSQRCVAISKKLVKPKKSLQDDLMGNLQTFSWLLA